MRHWNQEGKRRANAECGIGFHDFGKRCKLGLLNGSYILNTPEEGRSDSIRQQDAASPNETRQEKVVQRQVFMQSFRTECEE